MRSHQWRDAAWQGTDNIIRIWDVAGAVESATLKGHGRVASLAFAADGRTLASTNNGSIKLWDVARGAEKATLKIKGASLGSKIAFSPDGKTLASGGEQIRFWRAQTAQVVAERLADEDAWELVTQLRRMHHRREALIKAVSDRGDISDLVKSQALGYAKTISLP